MLIKFSLRTWCTKYKVSLYDKVVPRNKNFNISDSSKVSFNLYKLGKIYEIEVDKKLPTNGGGLTYCRSLSDNLAGPLQEEALVHSDGTNQQEASVEPGHVKLVELFFEKFGARRWKNILCELDKQMDHGLGQNLK